LFARIKELHGQAVAALAAMKDAIAVRYGAMSVLFAAEADDKAGSNINVLLADQLGMDKQMVGKARAKWREEHGLKMPA
jgi:hypothetical protein